MAICVNLFLAAATVQAQHNYSPNPYFEQAKSSYKKGNFEQSLELALMADSVFKSGDDKAGELQSKLLLSKVYTVKRNPLMVETTANAAVGLLAATGMKDSLVAADIYNTLAGALLEQRRFEESESAYYQAISIKKRVLGDNTREIGMQITNLANLYFKKGDLAKAIQLGKKGIEIREAGISPNPLLLTAYTNFGIYHKEAGLYHQALDLYTKIEKIVNSDLEKYKEKAGPLYQSMANLYHDLGDYDKSRKYAALAIRYFGQVWGAESTQVSNIYYNLALLAGDINDRTAQIDNARKAASILIANKEQDHQMLADCYEQISVGFLNVHPDSSLFYARISSQLLEAIQEPDETELGSNLSCFAMAYAAVQQFDLADSLMNIAINKIVGQMGKKGILTANYHSNYADIFQKAQKTTAALQQYDLALAALGYSPGCLWDTVIHANELLETLTLKNRILVEVFEKGGHDDLAPTIENNWLEILRLLDYLRRRHQGNEAKLVFAQQFTRSAESAIGWFYKRPSPENWQLAWEFAEKARSLALLEAFRNTYAWNTALASDSLRSQADAFAAEKRNLQHLYSQATNENERSGYLVKMLESDQRQEKWLQILEKEDSLFFKARYDNRVVPTDEVKQLLEPGQALLAYFVGDSNIYIFVVRADSFIIRTVKRNFPLDDWIEQMRVGIYGHYSTQKSQTFEYTLRAYVNYAPALYDRLIAPVSDVLPSKVIIVPDGPLGYLPFDALLSSPPADINNFRKYPYLLYRYQFSYAYSATLLREMREKKHQQTPDHQFIAFAPFYDGNPLELKRRFENDTTIRKDLQPLVHSGPEIAVASKLMGGEMVAGAAATREQFIRVSKNYRMIHLATHGRSDNRMGDYAFLAFTSIADSLDNELLFVKDLYELTLNTDLVVLSACETGIGKLQRGEGIISLARAFAFAGAKSMVTTLWEVNDLNTAKLMGNFYAALKKGENKSEALRLARLRYLKESKTIRFCHPFFWAAFIPIGDMRPVFVN